MYSHLKRTKQLLVSIKENTEQLFIHRQQIELIFLTYLTWRQQKINLVDGSTTIWTYFCTNIIQPSHSTLEKDSIHHWGDVTVWKAQMFESENRCQKLVKAYTRIMHNLARAINCSRWKKIKATTSRRSQQLTDTYCPVRLQT